MKFPINKPYHLFASCIPIKGYNRSIIYDLERYTFEYIPNSLFDILTEFDNVSFSDLIEKVKSKEEKDILENYFDFLFEQEFIFFSELNSNFFPKLDINFFKPINVSCLVVDLNVIISDYLVKLRNEIIETKVQCLVFRLFHMQKNDMKVIFDFFNEIPVRTIQLFIDDENRIDNAFIEEMIALNGRLSVVLRYNAKTNLIQNIKGGVLVYTKRDVINSNMEINSISDFDVNKDLFMESNLYNNYFHKRTHIDLNGEIYRFERDLASFGNIKLTSLLETQKKLNFKEFWDIKKDDVIICKDCEYRYMCVDSRKPLSKNDNNLWVLEGNCNYDPYTSKWNNNSN